MGIINDLIGYLDECTSNYHSIMMQAKILKDNGFVELLERDKWNIERGGRYYVNRNDSSIIAFTIPNTIDSIKFNICASHCDSPTFKIKNNPDINVEGSYIKLNVEGYGGSILHTWIDRPLSVAGRIFIDGKKDAILVDINKDICMIPSLAIHMNRDANKGYEWNIQKDMLPLMTLDTELSLMDIVAKEAGVDKSKIVSHDLYLYNRDKAKTWGAKEEFLSAARLDDQACAFSALTALVNSCSNDKCQNAINIHVVFDNEEVGSSSIQGACSTLLKDTLERITEGVGITKEDYHRAIADSFMFSADNAHALHPNYTDKCDPTNRPVLGKGVVIKFAGNQKYTTDGASAAKTYELAKRCDIKLQSFHNRSDMAGGSTLGNLSANQVPVSSADIGMAQLAMHSCYETIASCDVEDMVKLIEQLYQN